MAVQELREQYEHVTIDCAEGVLTEIYQDDIRSFNIGAILRRWDGVPDITLTIERQINLMSGEEGEHL